jgi:Rad3-related DNA helicase
VKTVDLKPDAEMLKEVKEYFPHQSIRRYQGDLANSIYQALTSGEKNVVVEAPTGLGKGLGSIGVHPLP